MADERWWELALCAQVDPELWYPAKGGSVREALAICNRCEARAECLEAAVASEALQATEPQGVQGGLTARQRAPLVRARKAELRTQPAEPDAVARVRQLAGAGLRDPEIGREVDMSPKAVEILRRRNRIAAGRPVVRGRAPATTPGGVR